MPFRRALHPGSGPLSTAKTRVARTRCPPGLPSGGGNNGRCASTQFPFRLTHIESTRLHLVINPTSTTSLDC
eukprot:1069391-Prorocentrum_minimum.AAC.1